MELTTQTVAELCEEWANIMAENREELIRMDGIMGDSDLGLTMSDGFAAAAVQAKAYTGQDLGEQLYLAGKAMATAVPSTMGTLMASGLMEAGKQWKGQTCVPFARLGELFAAFEAGVMRRGKAAVGDKTFLDGFDPAVQALADEPENMIVALRLAEQKAVAGAQATVGMLAKHGRAAARGEASRSLLDPGAVVARLLTQATATCMIRLFEK